MKVRHQDQRTFTILVVDDLDEVRGLACEMLRSSGYCALSAESGPAAIEICKNHPGSIHLLLTDLEMPGMNGLELSESLLKSLADMRVIFMSGAGQESVSGFLGPLLERLFLKKPFTREQLLLKVRDALA